MARYTFDVHRLPDETPSWVAECDAFTGFRVTGYTREGALDLARHHVVTELRRMYAVAEPFPEPPLPDRSRSSTPASSEAIIEAQLKRYTFSVVTSSVSSFAIACDAYPGAVWYVAAYAPTAIELHKDEIRRRLCALRDRGQPFPQPPIKESK